MSEILRAEQDRSPDTSAIGEKIAQGKFLYAVILSGETHALGAVGLNGGRVYTIGFKDIGAVVSDYPINIIRPLRKNLSPYHQVIRVVAESSTTIPAKFGQIAQGEGEVRRLLRVNYSRLKQELSRLHNKVEMGLKVFWEVDNLHEYFLQQDHALKALRDRLLHRPSPPTRQESIGFGSLLRDRMREMKEQVSQKVIKSLEGMAIEVKVDEPTEERMALNSVFLVSKEKQKEFEERVERVAELFGMDYNFKLDGPWVPFNFVENIELGL